MEPKEVLYLLIKSNEIRQRKIQLTKLEKLIEYNQNKIYKYGECILDNEQKEK